jgi:glycosyltransferase involved in cell wall biosynthesis
MRVLQINSVCGVGSTGRIVTDIHQILLEQGHESYIAFGRDEPKNCETSIRIGTKLDNYTHVALTRLFDRHGFGSVAATKDFIRKVDALDPDIIHMHNIHGYYINIEVLFNYLKRSNKPVVWTLHDCWPFTGHCSYFDYVGCDKWKTECHNCPQKKEYPASKLIDSSEENFRRKKELFAGLQNMTIVAPSNWLAGLVKESYLNKYSVQVINNGIDLKVFQPIEGNFREKFNLEKIFIILGAASVWERRKGLEFFIELSKSLKSDEVIVMVGLTDRQIKKLPSNIIGIKKTNSTRELAEIYSAADVFLNPTLEDNFPTTNLEALACGTPIITFNTGGSAESIDKTCGLVIEKGNTKILQKGIDQILNNNFESSQCIRRSKLFDKYERVGDYMELYSESITQE